MATEVPLKVLVSMMSAPASRYWECISRITSGLVSTSGTVADVCGAGSQISGTSVLSFTGGSLAAYFAVATALGFQALYAPNPDFGAILFEDYFSLVLWAFGFQGAQGCDDGETNFDGIHPGTCR